MSDYKVNLNGLENRYKTLTHQEFIDKICEYQNNQDENVKEELILSNLKLVLSLISKYNQKNYCIEDLFQVGVIGLMKAIHQFDIKYNVKFSTYAVPLVNGEIKRYVRDQTGIKISRSIHDLAYHVLNERESYMLKNEKELSISELAQRMNLNEYQIVEALHSTNSLTSLSQDIQNGTSHPIELIDSIPHPKNDFIDCSYKMDLDKAYKKLDDKEKYIIDQRYYLDKTQSEIALDLSLSQAQVSRLEKQALNHLKKYLSL